MTTEEAIAAIHALDRFNLKPGLDRVRELLRRLGNPSDAAASRGMRFVHVAGTNGKGSVCVMTAGILRAGGLKTGLFTSPYVLNFRERIQIDGEMIPEDELAALYEETAPHVEALRNAGDCPTEFEVITALALCHYRRQNCDIAVLEVGLGGDLDSTNVIEAPLCSAITSVSYDHMDVLGGTLAAIAGHKCGILKPGCPAVCAPNQPEEALAVIRETAAARGCPLTQTDISGVHILREDLAGTLIAYDGLELDIPLIGRHQIANAATAVEIARALAGGQVRQGIALTDEHIRRGIAAARIPARMEVFAATPPLILDGAHNADAARVLADNLVRLIGGWELTLVMGMMGDKEYIRVLETLAPLASHFYCVTPPDGRGRALPAQALADAARPYCRDVRAVANPHEALAEAAREHPGAALAVCGSLYLAAEVRGDLLALAERRAKAR